MSQALIELSDYLTEVKADLIERAEIAFGDLTVYTQADKITDMQLVGITNLDDIYHEHMGGHKKAFKAAKRLSAAGLAFIEDSSGGPVVARSCAGALRMRCARRRRRRGRARPTSS